MYRIASTIIHFKYFEHLRSLNVANFFFWYSIVQNHVWPSLLGSQDRTRCDEPPSQKLPNYWRDPHQASTSIQKWRSKSRRPDIYRPILRNIYSFPFFFGFPRWSIQETKPMTATSCSLHSNQNGVGENDSSANTWATPITQPHFPGWVWLQQGITLHGGQIKAIYRSIWGWVKTLVPLVNIKIAGKWMFIPLKMYL